MSLLNSANRLIQDSWPFSWMNQSVLDGPLGVTLLLAVLLLGAIGFVVHYPGRVPMAVTRRERARRRTLRRVPHLARGVLRWAAWLLAAVVAVALWTLIVPLNRPAMIVLTSRALPPSEHGRDALDQLDEEDKQAALETWTVLDGGPHVDRALASIADRGCGRGRDIHAVGDTQELRSLLVQSSSQDWLWTWITDEPQDPEDWVRCLGRDLVEAVEISVVFSLRRSNNVRAAVVQSAPSVGAEPAWSVAKEALEGTGVKILGPDATQTATDGLHVVRIGTAFLDSEGQLAFDVLFRGVPKNGNDVVCFYLGLEGEDDGRLKAYAGHYPNHLTQEEGEPTAQRVVPILVDQDYDPGPCKVEDSVDRKVLYEQQSGASGLSIWLKGSRQDGGLHGLVRKTGDRSTAPMIRVERSELKKWSEVAEKAAKLYPEVRMQVETTGVGWPTFTDSPSDSVLARLSQRGSHLVLVPSGLGEPLLPVQDDVEDAPAVVHRRISVSPGPVQCEGGLSAVPFGRRGTQSLHQRTTAAEAVPGVSRHDVLASSANSIGAQETLAGIHRDRGRITSIVLPGVPEESEVDYSEAAAQLAAFAWSARCLSGTLTTEAESDPRWESGRWMASNLLSESDLNQVVSAQRRSTRVLSLGLMGAYLGLIVVGLWMRARSRE